MIPSGVQWVPVAILTALGLYAVALKARHRDRRRKVTGIAPPGHIDLDVTLDEDEVTALLGIERGLRAGAGLAILDGTEGAQS